MAILKIDAPIVCDNEQVALSLMGIDGLSYRSVGDFLASIPEDDDTIDLRIHCVGGDVWEGWAIADALRASGKRITATIEGLCASMASIILLAASERRAYPHAELIIHNPFLSECPATEKYDSDFFQRWASDLQTEEEKMLNFYVERTGADRDTLKAIMAEDRVMDMREALSLGFIHEILPPLSAKSTPKINNKTDKMSKFSKIGKAICDVLGITPEGAMVDLELTTATGATLTVEREEGEPQVGDAARPDGQHIMPDGRTIEVEDGYIVEISMPEETPAEEYLEDAVEEPETPAEEEYTKERFAELEAELVEKDKLLAEKDAIIAEREARIAELEALLAEADKKAASAEEREMLNIVSKAGGHAWLTRVAASNYTPAKREVDKVPAASAIASERDALKAKIFGK